VVLDSEENIIGSVLTCVTDMGIGWHQNKIYSIASPGKPADVTPRGPCCEFVKVIVNSKPGKPFSCRTIGARFEFEWSMIFDRITAHAAYEVK